ncbi:zinc finger domain-containing protein [Fusarium heterosporum]|uniref:Zinc finger domain-containing protein n=1 Tax=Fusarium heterosporum TaxID=42747 RepID=A0A8H5SX21_FUSHE|nr:zinc finger domain-containing protein [Fusarium heterosporum]
MTSTNTPLPDLSTSYSIIGSSSRVDVGRILFESLYNFTRTHVGKYVGQAVQPPDYLEKLASDNFSATFALSNGTVAMKLAKDSFSHELWLDYAMSKHICDVFSVLNINGVNFPNFNSFMPRDNSQVWADMHKEYQFFTSAYLTERVPPIPLSLQLSLMKAFSKELDYVPITHDLASHDCLVRLYFGSLGGATKHSGDDLPYNFELHLNHMIELGVSRPFYFAIVRDMATALAALHWAACTAANGVKFVLGGPRERQRLDATIAGHDQVCLWALNLEKAACIPFGVDGVAMAVDAYMANDPYYPRPSQQDSTAKYVWLVFKEAYLSASNIIFGPGHTSKHRLPVLFIEGIEDRLRDGR